MALTASQRRRLLPIPAGPVINTARATGSETHSSKSDCNRESSRSRPMNGVGFPSSVRPTSKRSRRPRMKRPASSPPRSNSAPSNPAVTSSIRTGPGAAPSPRATLAESRSSDAARSMTSPSGTRFLMIARPVESTRVLSGSLSRITRAQRAAWATWSGASRPR